VREFLAWDIDADNFISEWTLSEFYSALSLKLRTSQISSEIKLEAEAFFAEARNTLFKMIVVSSADFLRAAELAGKTGALATRWRRPESCHSRAGRRVALHS
jgi:hypothetical protein